MDLKSFSERWIPQRRGNGERGGEKDPLHFLYISKLFYLFKHAFYLLLKSRNIFLNAEKGCFMSQTLVPINSLHINLENT